MRYGKGRVPSRAVRSKWLRTAIIIVLIVVVAISIYNDFKAYQQAKQGLSRVDGLFSVHYIDIGQGDATLLRSPDGDYMLVDCGPTKNGDYLVKYLNDMGVERLEYILITHPHEDHYGGFSRVMESFEVEGLILHKDNADTYPYDKFADIAESYDTELLYVCEGSVIAFDDCAEFEIIGPEYVDEEDANESSLCFRVVYEDTAFMFTGDAEKGTEKYLLSTGKPLEADVFQAGHHGSSTSNTSELLQAVNPYYVVVSCEENNSYGHPHKKVVQRFEELGITMLETYKYGSICFVSDGENVTYTEDFFAELNSPENQNEKEVKVTFLDYIYSFF